MFKTSSSSFRLDLTNSEDSLSQKYSTLLIRCGLAEFIGTAILVIIACGTCVSTHKENDTFLASSLAGGLTVVCLALAFGQVSGAHLNPAVTVGLLFNGKIDCLKALVYAICQIVGGTAGAAILSLVLPSGTQDLCPTTVSNDISPIQAIAIEITITFLLVFVVCSCGQNQISPLVIGIAVIGGHLFAIPLTSASMNSARSFGPALLSSTWEFHYVYWIGPILGGILAGITHKFLFKIDSN